jgi:hypothetical protein
VDVIINSVQEESGASIFRGEEFSASKVEKAGSAEM